MKIRDCMKRQVYTLPDTACVRDAVNLVLRYHIGMLPVVDVEGKLVGVVKLRDLLELGMPDFVDLVHDFAFVSHFGAGELQQPDPADLARPVREVMREPIFVEENSSPMYAAALLHHHAMRDLPVVDERGILIGLASHVDIGCAVMRAWKLG